MKTYERIIVNDEIISLYPTFKEWKQFLHHFISWNMACLYPTFKEWKHRNQPWQ